MTLAFKARRFALCLWLVTAASFAHNSDRKLAEDLGWIEDASSACGGYYLEAPFFAKGHLHQPNKFEVTSDQYTISKKGKSTLEGRVIINHGARQILANKAYLYRDPRTGKLAAADLHEALHLREPNTLILANNGFVDFQTRANRLEGILYRTSIYGNLTTSSSFQQILDAAAAVPGSDLEKNRKVHQLSAWGEAKHYYQDKPRVYNFDEVTYSTCPPTHRFWQLRASHIELDKETGRGTAKHARLMLKGVPVFYTPYLNFPIDTRRKTGFLWPTLGSLNRNNSNSGYYFGVPFYWNLAPNYDTTITPTLYSERGIQIADLFRYLTPKSDGVLRLSILPDDGYFPTFKETQQTRYGSSTDVFKQAELANLVATNNFRSSISLQHHTKFSDHWSANVDYNYVSDDYFLEDFSTNLTENAQNQLPQLADLTYASEHWNFTGRLQSYQTLHPIDVDSVFKNQYSRFPQLLLTTDYPNQWKGLHFFASTEATHFDIRNTPGDDTKFAMGDRIHVQPGVELPLVLPYFFIKPQAQVALSEYELGHVVNDTPKHQDRGLPIFAVRSGLYLDRSLHFMGRSFQNTLEPEALYLYVPYRNQRQIPVFDTTVNTLNYDQLFSLNRFSSIDRINDANQLTIGITTRLIDSETGQEHLRLGVGEIFYFKDRVVTLCDSPDLCTDYPHNSDNQRRFSPVAGVLNYTMSPHWNATANAIWNPQTRELDNQTISLQYHRDAKRTINLGFSYVRNDDPLAGIINNANADIAGLGNQNSLKLTDLSFTWPLHESWGFVGRWSEDWNTLHFQNLFYGLQYDSCCWAAQFVAGRTFVGIQQNRPQYTNQFYFQVTLKGLGTFNPKGDPTALLKSNISGYDSPLGQDL